MMAAPIAIVATGPLTNVPLDGSRSRHPGGRPLTYSWTTTCYNSTFSDPNIAQPILTVDSYDGCYVNCTVTLTISDGVIEPVSCSTTVHLTDVTAPRITCPPDTTVECDASTTPWDTGWASAQDNCDVAVQVRFRDQRVPGSCPQSWTIQRTWTAIDKCANRSSCVQTITVADRTAPQIYCPSDAFVPPGGSIDPNDLGYAYAYDNCDPSPDITYVDQYNFAECPENTIIHRIWTATDHCGNSSTCTQTITLLADAQLIPNGATRYRLHNHPDSGKSGNLYGLRLDNLENDKRVLLFDFDDNRSSVWMDVSPDAIHIFGRAVCAAMDGGEDRATLPTYALDFTYLGAIQLPNNDDMAVPGVNDRPLNQGVVQREPAVRYSPQPLWEDLSDEFTFQFGDDRAGSYDGPCGWGNLLHAGGEGSWMFAAEPRNEVLCNGDILPPLPITPPRITVEP